LFAFQLLPIILFNSFYDARDENYDFMLEIYKIFDKFLISFDGTSVWFEVIFERVAGGFLNLQCYEGRGTAP
jgi:hypothetical protein